MGLPVRDPLGNRVLPHLQPVPRQRAVRSAAGLAQAGEARHRYRRGAGTTFNMLRTLGEAYKVGQLQHYRLSAVEAFYHATLGGARALALDDKIGNFNVGKEADFVVLDPAVTPLQQLRYANSATSAEQGFVLMTLGTIATFIAPMWTARWFIRRRADAAAPAAKR